jgi:hypothetical protein
VIIIIENLTRAPNSEEAKKVKTKNKKKQNQKHKAEEKKDVLGETGNVKK